MTITEGQEYKEAINSFLSMKEFGYSSEKQREWTESDLLDYSDHDDEKETEFATSKLTSRVIAYEKSQPCLIHLNYKGRTLAEYVKNERTERLKINCCDSNTKEILNMIPGVHITSSATGKTLLNGNLWNEEQERFIYNDTKQTEHNKHQRGDLVVLKKSIGEKNFTGEIGEILDTIKDKKGNTESLLIEIEHPDINNQRVRKEYHIHPSDVKQWNEKCYSTDIERTKDSIQIGPMKYTRTNEGYNSTHELYRNGELLSKWKDGVGMFEDDLSDKAAKQFKVGEQVQNKYDGSLGTIHSCKYGKFDMLDMKKPGWVYSVPEFGSIMVQDHAIIKATELDQTHKHAIRIIAAEQLGHKSPHFNTAIDVLKGKPLNKRDYKYFAENASKLVKKVIENNQQQEAAKKADELIKLTEESIFAKKYMSALKENLDLQVKQASNRDFFLLVQVRDHVELMIEEQPHKIDTKKLNDVFAYYHNNKKEQLSPEAIERFENSILAYEQMAKDLDKKQQQHHQPTKSFQSIFD